MRLLIALAVVSFAVGAFSQCICPNSKWATCEDNPCQCTLLFDNTVKQPVDCTRLLPKCFLMKAQMQRARMGKDTRTIGGKPIESAFVDNDGVYDPDCEADGKFKAKQCNGTQECWCVNSAGVRRTDKGDKDDIKCDELVETYWLRMQMVHKPLSKEVTTADVKTAMENVMLARYKLAKSFVKDVQYDPEGRMVVMDVKKDIGNRNDDLTRVGWYMEKDIKELAQFNNQDKFEPMVAGQKMEMEKIVVYYVDEKGPEFSMRHLTGGIIAVIVVVIVAVIAGLLVLFLMKRREKQRYSKAQGREMDNM